MKKSRRAPVLGSLQMITRVSRPRFWLYLAGPYLIGTVLAVTSVAQLWSLSFFLWLLFFLIPANVFLYGINDLYDEDTDKHNVKKGTKEHLLQATQRRTVRLALTCSVLCFSIGFFAVRGQAWCAYALLVLLALSWAYSAPPIRCKARPVIDALSNALYLMPGIFGYVQFGGALPSTSVLLALIAWTSAMQIYSAVPDIVADAKAKLRTTAVVLGARASLVLCMALWAVFAFVLIRDGGAVLGPLRWFALVYLALPLIALLGKNLEQAAERVYWWYPYITGVFGFVAWWYIALVVKDGAVVSRATIAAIIG